MTDRVIRGLALDGRARAYAADTTETMRELQRRHGTFPVATAALGRTITAGAIMGAMLKGEERLTVRIKGDGPIGQIVVDAGADGVVRGYVDNPHVDLPPNDRGKLDVRGAVGEGSLYVVKDLGLKDPYVGSVPLVSGEIAEDVTYYFAKSEQTPSAVALGVLVDTDGSVRVSGGFVLQLMPGIAEEDIAGIERKLEELGSVTEKLDREVPLVDLMRELVPSFTALDELPVTFRCRCSRARIDSTLIGLGREELESMLAEQGGAEVICHFCSERYVYDAGDLRRLIARIDGGGAGGEEPETGETKMES